MLYMKIKELDTLVVESLKQDSVIDVSITDTGLIEVQ